MMMLIHSEGGRDAPFFCFWMYRLFDYLYTIINQLNQITMNNFSREIISDIHQLVSKAKAFENQLEPLANLYNEVKSMTEQLEDLNAKVLDIETNINKGGINADDLRQILRDRFSYLVPRELLKFDIDADSVERSFECNAEGDVEINDQVFDVQNQCEIYLEDYELGTSNVNWHSVAEDINFDADFDDDALESLIDTIIDKVCPSSQDVSNEMIQEDEICS